MPSKKTEQFESLEQRLNKHPELKTRIEFLLSVVENAEGDLVKANEAEQRMIEETRQLGQVALQSWAIRQNQQQSQAFSIENPSAHRSGKKNCTGIADLDVLKF